MTAIRKVRPNDKSGLKIFGSVRKPIECPSIASKYRERGIGRTKGKKKTAKKRTRKPKT